MFKGVSLYRFDFFSTQTSLGSISPCLDFSFKLKFSDLFQTLFIDNLLIKNYLKKKYCKIL